jgi:hypothetical protein
MMMKTVTSGQRKKTEKNPRAQKKMEGKVKILFISKFTPYSQSVKNYDTKLDETRHGKAD